MKSFAPFPLWGPYGKKYMGLSRIVDHKICDGVRFDFCTVPAIFGGDIRVPNCTLPSGCHPWHCNSDYSLITYRHDLEWKDRVYAEVSYVKLTEESFLIRTELVNHSELIQNMLINYFESLEFPHPTYCKVSLPKKHDLLSAVSYDVYTYATPRPWDEQNADGFKKGEFLDQRFLNGTGLGDRANKWHLPHRVIAPFGGEKGDMVKWTIPVTQDYENAVLLIRYRTCDIHYEQGKMVGVQNITGKKAAVFRLNGSQQITFAPTDDLAFAEIPVGKQKKGSLSVELVSEGLGAAEFDFLCLTEKQDASSVKTETAFYDYMPSVSYETIAEGGTLTRLSYPQTDGFFDLRTFSKNTRYRNIETGALEDCMTARLSNSDPSFDDVTESFTGAFSRKHSDDGFFRNTLVHTIFVQPGESHIEYAVLSYGKTSYQTKNEYEKLYQQKRKENPPLSYNKAGEPYQLSTEILRATLLTNAVYPIYKHGENIIHHTPGKRWDCLYTWDSGFIGLGMLEWAPRFADYSLNTYLSDESNPDYAFLHHGSPVPVQMYLYLEMLKRAKNKEALLSLYPKLKLYYDFLAGKIRKSTTAKFKSGLTTTYDYFYSSSGMDDYPAQVAMMNRSLRDTAAPVISTSQVIRCAKILYITAKKTGREEDAKTYLADIDRLTKALNRYSWDKESGYYGYVLHTAQYEPSGELLRTKDGENLNKGLDGIYPIIAGVCDESQKQAILSHLKNEKEMLSPYGISAVDQSASYFTVNGYWNGNIWFPHQWFIWKTMLDLGESDFAFEIAKRALNVWKREVDASYYTFEMVNVVTGRGGWFHNFGGLSTPIGIWADAYYKPGVFTSGFDTWVDDLCFSDENQRMTATITGFTPGKKCTLLAVMNENKDYRAFLDEKEIPIFSRFPGEIEICWSVPDTEPHKLIIEKK